MLDSTLYFFECTRYVKARYLCDVLVGERAWLSAFFIHSSMSKYHSILYKYWLLRVIWLKLWLPRWSPERSIFLRRSRGKIERYGDHRGSHSFNHCTSKSSQYLFYNTPNISKYCTIIIKLHTWMLQSTDDANTDCNPKWLQAINVSS